MNFPPGELVNTPKGPGIVIGRRGQRVLVTPTGQDSPYSTRLAYCEAWRPGHLVRRGWQHPPEERPAQPAIPQAERLPQP